MITSHRLEWERLQPVFKDLETESIARQMVEKVGIAFEMPIELILPSSGGYAAFEGARRTWGHSWLVPQINWYADSFTSRLEEEFGLGWVVRPFLDDIPFLKEDVASKTANITERVRQGFITYDRAQKLLDEPVLPELEGMIFVPALNVPVPISELPTLWERLAPPSPDTQSSDASPAPESGPAGFESPELSDQPKMLPGSPGNGENIDAQKPKPDIEELVPEQPPRPTRSRIPERQYNELKAWRAFAKSKSSKSEFLVSWLREDVAEYIRESLQAGMKVETVFTQAKSRLFQKSITSTESEFKLGFEQFLREAQDKSFSRRRARVIVDGILTKFDRRAYRDGLIDGGVEDGIMTEDDLKTFEQQRKKTSSILTSFLDKLFADGWTEAELGTKSTTWWNKTVRPFYILGLESANENQMLEFTGEDGDESCMTCLYLKGQIHRASVWKKRGLRPGLDAHNYQCGGYNCVHYLTPTESRSRGQLPTPAQIASWLAQKSSYVYLDHSHPPMTDLQRLEYEIYLSTEGFTVKYSTNQPRDRFGRFASTSGGGGGSSDESTSTSKPAQGITRTRPKPSSTDTNSSNDPSPEASSTASESSPDTSPPTSSPEPSSSDSSPEEAISNADDDGTPKISNGLTPDDFEEVFPYVMKSESWDFWDEIDENDRASVVKYTGPWYDHVNNGGLRRNGNGLTEEDWEHVSRIDKTLDTRPLSRNIKTYRGDNGGGLPNGGNLTDEQFQALAGTTFTDMGYTSTSVNPHGAFSGQYKYEIYVPKGTRGAYVDNISVNPGEAEFMLGRGHKFRIIETGYTPEGLRKIKMEVVPDTGSTTSALGDRSAEFYAQGRRHQSVSFPTST
ncbi:MAG: hypothetical protein HC888_06870 [Candidatus Competibacteraceae bacterium]|nr:hypothetical protein [Candidatus Competibacteraceae bacterium]